MTPGTTIPAGIGVWEGARVVINAPGYLDIPTGTVGTVAHRGRMGGWEVATCPPDVWSPRTYLTDVEDLHLDLTHRPTRLEVTARAANRLCPQHAPVMCAAVMAGNALWPDRLVYGISVTSLLSGEEWHSLDQHIPALADLDPTDDTRLPDGARVVDVRALAIVCQHVFGGTS